MLIARLCRGFCDVLINTLYNYIHHLLVNLNRGSLHAPIVLFNACTAMHIRPIISDQKNNSHMYKIQQYSCIQYLRIIFIRSINVGCMQLSSYISIFVRIFVYNLCIMYIYVACI